MRRIGKSFPAADSIAVDEFSRAHDPFACGLQFKDGDQSLAGLDDERPVFGRADHRARLDRKSSLLLDDLRKINFHLDTGEKRITARVGRKTTYKVMNFFGWIGPANVAKLFRQFGSLCRFALLSNGLDRALLDPVDRL